MRMESLISDPATPLLRQRARLAQVLASLDAEQWARPSRCAGWSIQDVVAHLVTTNQFWALSISSGVRGEPTRFLKGFDPVATPAQMVEAVRSWTAVETLEQYTESNGALAASIEALDERSWSALAEAPPGHLTVALVALHALWDSWIHERDIVLPLGLDAVEEADEIVASLAYVAALGPAFLAASGSTRTGALELRVTRPDARMVVDVGPTIVVHDGPCPAGTVTLTGDAVELLEALSFRAPFTSVMSDGDRWMLGGLGAVFERTG
ncbi:MAG: hypothetical protein JWN46_3217 [Acidimicrobiales bacterium]|nr:hypothetical protein [Acidimicrobiales bacterium]